MLESTLVGLGIRKTGQTLGHILMRRGSAKVSCAYIRFSPMFPWVQLLPSSVCSPCSLLTLKSESQRRRARTKSIKLASESQAQASVRLLGGGFLCLGRRVAHPWHKSGTPFLVL